METKLQTANLSIVKTFFDELKKKNQAAIADLFGANIIFEVPLSPSGDPRHG